MQYNIHVSKYKYGDIGGIQKEQFREYKDKDKYKNDIDHGLTDRNVYHRYHDQGWHASINDAKDKHEKLTGKGIRKDAVVFDSIVQSVPASWNYDLAKEYFLENENFLKEFLKRKGIDEDCFLSAVTHYDESSPHQTFVFMPVQNGKFNNSKIMNKVFLQDLQKEGYEFYLDFANRHPELEKLDPYLEGHGRKHLELEQYKVKSLEEKLKTIQSEIEIYTKTVNTVVDRMSKASTKLEQLDEQLPVDELNELNKKIASEPKDTGKVSTKTGSKLYRWQSSIDWFNSLKQAFDALLRWFKDRNLILTEMRPTKEEQQLIENSPKSIYDHIAEAEKLMKENNSTKVEKNKNKEYEH